MDDSRKCSQGPREETGDGVPVSDGLAYALAGRGWEKVENGDYEYLELGEEGYGSTDTEQRLRMTRLLVDYLERRL
jgi:hypothetical protein